MIAWVRSGNRRIFTACFPVEFARINNYTAERCTVTADEFSSRMNDDVSAVLERADKIRRAERVVNDNR